MGVALVDGPWGRTTAKVGAFVIRSAHPHGPAAVVAEKLDRRSVLIDSSANSANSATSVRS